MTQSTGTPEEEYVLSETERWARQLNVKVVGQLSNADYFSLLDNGRMVRNLGWYNDGTAYFWRPWVVGESQYDNSFPALSCAAAHEVCHAIDTDNTERHSRCLLETIGHPC